MSRFESPEPGELDIIENLGDGTERIRGVIVPMVDGTYAVLVNGFQWGPLDSPRDRSGAAGDTWTTPREAFEAWRAENG